jgi:hypothetical protein
MFTQKQIEAAAEFLKQNQHVLSWSELAKATLEAAEAAAWQPIDMLPEEPCQVEYFCRDMTFTTASGDVVSGVIEPWRDERRELGYWDGRTWRRCGTGHEVFEFEDTPRDWLPTHWRPLPPAPKAVD